MSPIRLHEDEELIYTFKRISDGKIFTEDSFISVLNQMKKSNIESAKNMVKRYDVFKGSEKITFDTYMEERGMSWETEDVEEDAPEPPAKKGIPVFYTCKDCHWVTSRKDRCPRRDCRGKTLPVAKTVDAIASKLTITQGRTQQDIAWLISTIDALLYKGVKPKLLNKKLKGDKVKILYNGNEIKVSDFMKALALYLGEKTPTEEDTTDAGDSEEATSEAEDSGEDTSTEEGSDASTSDETPLVERDINDKTIAQFKNLVVNLGLPVFRKSDNKSVDIDAITPDNAIAHTVRLGTKTAVDLPRWIKKLRSTGMLTEDFKEDFTADEMTKSGKIHLLLDISSEEDNPEFSLEVDELGQIVITPEDEGVSFEGASILVTNGETAFVAVDSDEEVDSPTLTIDYTMTSATGDYNYFITIDDIGQVVITPDSDDTSFITATVGDNLNIAADDETYELMESVDSVLSIVREKTENYTTLNGEIDAEDEESAKTMESALLLYYDNVEIVEKDGNFKVVYSDDPVEELNEDINDEDIDDEYSPEWTITYKFASDIEDDGETDSTTLKANSADAATKYGEQYARKMATEDESWKNAKIISLKLINN